MQQLNVIEIEIDFTAARSINLKTTKTKTSEVKFLLNCAKRKKNFKQHFIEMANRLAYTYTIAYQQKKVQQWRNILFELNIRSICGYKCYLWYLTSNPQIIFFEKENLKSLKLKSEVELLCKLWMSHEWSF